MSLNKHWQCAAPLRRLLLRVSVHADYEPGPAAIYAEALASRRKWTTRARDDIEQFIEDEVLRATDDEFAHMAMLEGKGHVCLLERRLAHWAQCANRQRSVAPTTNMVLDAAEQQRMADPRAG